MTCRGRRWQHTGQQHHGAEAPHAYPSGTHSCVCPDGGRAERGEALGRLCLTDGAPEAEHGGDGGGGHAGAHLVQTAAPSDSPAPEPEAPWVGAPDVTAEVAPCPGLAKGEPGDFPGVPAPNSHLRWVRYLHAISYAIT